MTKDWRVTMGRSESLSFCWDASKPMGAYSPHDTSPEKSFRHHQGGEIAPGPHPLAREEVKALAVSP
jgi:hypothetical protein